MMETKQIIRFIAETYHEAVLSGINMRAATETIEEMRSAMLSADDLFDSWDTIDSLVNHSFEIHRLQPLLIRLRKQWTKIIYQDECERIKSLFESDSKIGWIAWLHSYAAALMRFRLDFCGQLCDSTLPFLASDNLSIRQIRLFTNRARQGRWVEAFGLYTGLGDYEELTTQLRARSLSIAAEIIVYHLYQYERAEEFLRRAQKLAPDDWRVAYDWGTYYLQQQGEENRIKAKEWYLRTIEISPEMAIGYVGIGECLERENDLDGAEEKYIEATRCLISPSDGYSALLKLQREKQFFQSRKYEIPALVERLKAVALSELDIYNSMLSAGEAYRRNDMEEQAHEWYQRAIKFDFTGLSAYTSEAYLYLEAKLYPQAVASLKRAIDVAPEAMDGYWGMSWVAEEQKDWIETLHWCKQSLKRRPEWGGLIHARMGKIKLLLNDVDAALEKFFQSLEDDPKNEEALKGIGRCAEEYLKIVG